MEPKLVIYIVTTNDLLSLDVQVYVTMYENEAVRNLRPKGANSIELRLMICIATRDYHFQKSLKPELKYEDFLLDTLSKLFNPPDINIFNTLLAAELENSRKLKFIDSTANLTARGIFFIEINTQGGYVYFPNKFENLYTNYLIALQMPLEEHSMFGGCDCEEEEEIEEGAEPINEPVKLEIPQEEFIDLIVKYGEKQGLVDKLKDKIWAKKKAK